MRHQTLGDKKDFLATHVRNDEASATISAGACTVLSISGTEDGLRVVLPSTKSAAHALLFYYGVALADIPQGQVGEVQLFGLCLNATMVRQTRPTSTDTWNTEATQGISQLLSVNTVANALSTVASTRSIASTDTLALSEIPRAIAVLAQTLASYASSASATSDTRVAITASVKAFLFMM